jgi:hypothetical protein
MADVKPKMDQSERAARDLLNRKVREGVMERRTANQLLKVALPFVRAMLAQWRREGASPEWITGEFQSRLTKARQQLGTATTPATQLRAKTTIVAAEMYLAIWTGLQADLGQFKSDRRSARAIEGKP